MSATARKIRLGDEYIEKPKVIVVPAAQTAVVLHRRERLLKTVDYMEAQIGRLAKMARDVRAEILQLTTE